MVISFRSLANKLREIKEINLNKSDNIVEHPNKEMITVYSSNNTRREYLVVEECVKHQTLLKVSNPNFSKIVARHVLTYMMSGDPIILNQVKGCLSRCGRNMPNTIRQSLHCALLFLQSEFNNCKLKFGNGNESSRCCDSEMSNFESRKKYLSELITSNNINNNYSNAFNRENEIKNIFDIDKHVFNKSLKRIDKSVKTDGQKPICILADDFSNFCLFLFMFKIKYSDTKNISLMDTSLKEMMNNFGSPSFIKKAIYDIKTPDTDCNGIKQRPCLYNYFMDTMFQYKKSSIS